MGAGTDALNVLPLPRLAFDLEGVITAADRRVEELLGRTEDDLVGRNVVELVHPDDIERCLAMFDFAPRARHQSIGPIPIRYVHADGSAHDVSLWVQHRFDDPDDPGFTVVAIPATVEQRLSEVIAAAAIPDAGYSPIELVARALGARPLDSVAFVLAADGSVTAAPLAAIDDSLHRPELAPRPNDGGPWWKALADGCEVIVEDASTLPEPLAALAASAGMEALWCWPLHRGEGGMVPAVLVLWRELGGPPGPTHRVHLDGAVSAASLALEAERARERLEDMAYRDQLTGLANRSYLFGRALSQDPAGAAVVYVDLDGFKSINDTYGHHAGDQVLVAVAGRIRNAVRTTDLVSRVGGDEFVIVCPPPCTEDDATGIAERVLELLKDPVAIDVGTVDVGASIGVAMHTDQGTLEQLIRSADQALYTAKGSGRGRYEVR